MYRFLYLLAPPSASAYMWLLVQMTGSRHVLRQLIPQCLVPATQDTEGGGPESSGSLAPTELGAYARYAEEREERRRRSVALWRCTALCTLTSTVAWFCWGLYGIAAQLQLLRGSDFNPAARVSWRAVRWPPPPSPPFMWTIMASPT